MAWLEALLNRHGERVAWGGAALIALLTITIAGLASPAPHGAAGGHGAGAQGTAGGPKMCARYTDGCVLCPTAKYGPGCTTQGTACLKGAWYCAERG